MFLHLINKKARCTHFLLLLLRAISQLDAATSVEPEIFNTVDNVAYATVKEKIDAIAYLQFTYIWYLSYFFF